MSERFQELTNGRYGEVEFGPDLSGSGLKVAGQTQDFSALSLGTQEQLATLFRLAIAEQLKTALVLDDHLAQTDPGRVGWFRKILREAAEKIQIVVLTCRPLDYLDSGELPADGEAVRSLAGGMVQATNLELLVERFEPTRTEANR